MKRASTRCPASLRRAAETAESTPPERPMTTRDTASARRLADFEGAERYLPQQLERMARAPQVVVDRKLDQRAPVFVGTGREFVAIEPKRADDRSIQDGAGVPLAHVAREGHAQHRAARRPLPEVEARHRLRPELPSRFLPRFAHDGV